MATSLNIVLFDFLSSVRFGYIYTHVHTPMCNGNRTQERCASLYCNGNRNGNMRLEMEHKNKSKWKSKWKSNTRTMCFTLLEIEMEIARTMRLEIEHKNDVQWKLNTRTMRFTLFNSNKSISRRTHVENAMFRWRFRRDSRSSIETSRFPNKFLMNWTCSC